MGQELGDHRDSGVDRPEEFSPDELDADEGDPAVEAFAGQEQVLTPNPSKDGEHDYGYE